MSLTDREKAVAGFAWNAGMMLQSLEAMVGMLEQAESLGAFAPDFIARAAAGDCPSEAEIKARFSAMPEETN